MTFFCKLLGASLLAYFCQPGPVTAAPPATAAASAPAFYVVKARENGDAVLHASVKTFGAEKELSLIVLGAEQAACCFTFGAKKAGVKSTLKIDEDLPLLSTENGDETWQLAGYLKPELATQVAQKLAFGIAGMSAAKHTDKKSYEITLAGAAAPVIVKHCLGTEGVNFNLYHAASDKKPFATYYYALGYPVKSDCR